MHRFKSGQYLAAVAIAATGVAAGMMAGVCLAFILAFNNILPAIPLAVGMFISGEFLQLSSHYFIREG